jgi:hypothetical protein
MKYEPPVTRASISFEQLSMLSTIVGHYRDSSAELSEAWYS